MLNRDRITPFRVFVGIAFPLLIIAAYLIWPLYQAVDPATKATVLIGALSSIGTLSLAAATFYNIYQTNQRLTLEQQKWEKPLIKDVISTLIQPAIEAVEYNQDLLISDKKLSWVYVDDPTGSPYVGAGRPRSAFGTHDPETLTRFKERNPDLFGMLKSHDEKIRRLGEIAKRMHGKIETQIRQELREAGIQPEELDQSLKVVTGAILKGTEQFGENHELYEFWEGRREQLIEHTQDTAGEDLEQLETEQQSYEQLCEDIRDKLYEERNQLQNEYRIPSEQIGTREWPFDTQ